MRDEEGNGVEGGMIKSEVGGMFRRFGGRNLGMGKLWDSSSIGKLSVLFNGNELRTCYM
jgi:hypothetical protein